MKLAYALCCQDIFRLPDDGTVRRCLCGQARGGATDDGERRHAVLSENTIALGIADDRLAAAVEARRAIDSESADPGLQPIFNGRPGRAGLGVRVDLYLISRHARTVHRVPLDGPSEG